MRAEEIEYELAFCVQKVCDNKFSPSVGAAAWESCCMLFCVHRSVFRKILCTAVKATADQKGACMPRSISRPERRMRAQVNQWSSVCKLLRVVALRALHGISAVSGIEARESNFGHYFGVYSSKP